MALDAVLPVSMMQRKSKYWVSNLSFKCDLLLEGLFKFVLIVGGGGTLCIGLETEGRGLLGITGA